MLYHQKKKEKKGKKKVILNYDAKCIHHLLVEGGFWVSPKEKGTRLQNSFYMSNRG